MLEGRLSAGPLGPVAQYDCQRLAAVQLSLRSADLHCSLSHRLLAAAAALKLCALGVVTPGILSRDSSRRWRGGSSHPDYSSVLCNPYICRWRRTGCRRPNFFAQAAATVVVGRLLTGIGDLGVYLPGIFTQPRRAPSMFSWRALAVALDAPQMFSNFTCV